MNVGNEASVLCRLLQRKLVRHAGNTACATIVLIDETTGKSKPANGDDIQFHPQMFSRQTAARDPMANECCRLP